VKIPILLKKWKRQNTYKQKLPSTLLLLAILLLNCNLTIMRIPLKKEKDSKYWVHTFTPSIIFAFQTNQVQNFRRVLIIAITIVTKVQQVEESLEGYSKEV
jgi:membrane-associated HD superfamily phosphohydrolase